jgi:hypothetical protein
MSHAGTKWAKKCGFNANNCPTDEGFMWATSQGLL